MIDDVQFETTCFHMRDEVRRYTCRLVSSFVLDQRIMIVVEDALVCCITADRPSCRRGDPSSTLARKASC